MEAIMSDSSFFAESKVTEISFLSMTHGSAHVSITAFDQGRRVGNYHLIPDEARAMAADLTRRAALIEQDQAQTNIEEQR